MSKKKSRPVSSPIDRGRRLKKLRNMAGLILTDVSERHGVGLSTLKFWENGYGGGLTKKGAAKIITIMRQYGVYATVEWLLYGVEPQPQLRNIQYGEPAAAKEPVMLREVAIDYEIFVAQEMEQFRQHDANAVVMTVSDDGMMPFYLPEDKVGGLYVDSPEEIEAAAGKHCIIETEDHQVLCRRFVKSSAAEDVYNVFCVNSTTTVSEPMLYNVKLLRVAPIIRVWKPIS